MFSKRILEDTLNIVNVFEFVANKYENIMYRLKETYENKCARGIYVVEVVKIIKSSDCEIISSNVDSIGVIHVIFEVIAKIYHKYDIISEVSVKINKGTHYGITPRVLCTFSKENSNKLLSEDMIIPVMLDNKIEYETNNERVNAFCTILQAFTVETVYYINGTLDPKHYNNFEIILDAIKEQDRELDKAKSKIFIDMLNCYSNMPNKSNKDAVNLIEKITGSASIQINVTGYWERDKESDITDNMFIRRDKPPDDGEYVEIRTINAFADMLYQCYAYRQGIIDLTNTYSNKELFDKAKNIWEFIKRNQLIYQE